ncbi:MAG: hypothetical protein JSW45_02830 [Thiotrichales bacterium]|nr:MAG: hypothetical protein JSW45_02830 [Thiotrichales bacterium]
MKIQGIFWLLFSLPFFLFPAVPVAAQDWSEIERQMELEQRALAVNEGELQLLEKPPSAASHHHQNRLLITRQSLDDGWVTMYQCHSDLDRVSASQIVYNKARIRDIKITSSENIGSTWVEGHTVQMKDVGKAARICISADKRALVHENGKYSLKLGPFMRRFLDGYYPMRVQVEVCYPTFLRLLDSSPVKAIQRTRNNASYAEIDIWVVGKLDIEMVFGYK